MLLTLLRATPPHIPPCPYPPLYFPLLPYSLEGRLHLTVTLVKGIEK